MVYLLCIVGLLPHSLGFLGADGHWHGNGVFTFLCLDSMCQASIHLFSVGPSYFRSVSICGSVVNSAL